MGGMHQALLMSAGGGAAPPVTDPFWADVILLVDGAGTNGSTTLTDLSTAAHTITANANTQIDTSDPDFPEGAILVDGNGDDFSVSNTFSNFVFTASDSFTLDAWIKPLTFQNGENSIFGRYVGGANDNLWFYFNASGGSATEIAIRKGDTVIVTRSLSLAAGTPIHVQYAYDGGTGIGRYFIDGTQVGANITTMNVSSGVIGGALYAGAPGPSFPTSFEIHALYRTTRFTRACRNTSDFTPPTYPFPTS